VFRKFVVGKGQRGVLTRSGEFCDILRGGQYWYFDPLRRLSLETFGPAQRRFEHPIAARIARERPDVVAREFHTARLGPREVGLRYENGVLVEILPPGTEAWYWKGEGDLRCVVLDIGRDFTVARSLVPLLVDPEGEQRRAQVAGGEEAVYAFRVPERHSGLLQADGQVVKRLVPGLHAFWRFGRSLKVELVEWKPLEVPQADHQVAAA
jgi:hypothetical protein